MWIPIGCLKFKNFKIWGLFEFQFNFFMFFLLWFISTLKKISQPRWYFTLHATWMKSSFCLATNEEESKRRESEWLFSIQTELMNEVNDVLQNTEHDMSVSFDRHAHFIDFASRGKCDLNLVTSALFVNWDHTAFLRLRIFLQGSRCFS